jgi:hypothetical protein
MTAMNTESGLNQKGLLVFPFALYGSFFAFACGSLPNPVVVSFNGYSFSRRLFCHLNHCTFNSVCKKNVWY